VTNFEKQSTAVVVAATVELILSIAIAGLGIVMVIALSLAQVIQKQPPRPAVIVAGLVTSFVLLGVAAFGVVTAVGLLRNRNWSRLATIITAAILTFFSIITVIGTVSRFSGSAVRRNVLLTLSTGAFGIGLWWLLLFTRKHVTEQFSIQEIVTAPYPEFVHTDSTIPVVISAPDEPFARVKARSIFGWGLLSLLITVVLLLIILIAGRIAIGPAFDFRSPLIEPFSEIFLYGILLLFIVRMIRRAGLISNAILGSPMDWIHLRRYWLYPIFLVAVSAASYSVVFVPLSFAMPRFIDWYIIHSTSMQLFRFTGFGYSVANVLTFLTIVVIAPVVEEFVFRGVLLNRWAYKWGMPKAIALSSVIFGILHKEFLGHMFFGFVMCVLYVETKSLFVPIFMHAANNAIAWGWGTADLFWGASRQQTLAAFQSGWQSAAILAIVVIPLALWFIRNHYPKLGWTTPYAKFRRIDEVPES